MCTPMFYYCVPVFIESTGPKRDKDGFQVYDVEIIKPSYRIVLECSGERTGKRSRCLSLSMSYNYKEVPMTHKRRCCFMHFYFVRTRFHEVFPELNCFIQDIVQLNLCVPLSMLECANFYFLLTKITYIVAFYLLRVTGYYLPRFKCTPIVK